MIELKPNARIEVRRACWTLTCIVTAAALTVVFLRLTSPNRNAPLDRAVAAQLEAAHHVQAPIPAQRQTLVLAQHASAKLAALNAIGMEPREVGALAFGDPLTVFSVLSALGDFGEVIWLEEWTYFRVQLPPSKVPGAVVVPRREAVRAILEAIRAAGGCLIKAGPNRVMVVKVSKKKKYEAAIRALGWLDGKQPPWVKVKGDKQPEPSPQPTPEGRLAVFQTHSARRGCAECWMKSWV